MFLPLGCVHLHFHVFVFFFLVAQVACLNFHWRCSPLRTSNTNICLVIKSFKGMVLLATILLIMMMFLLKFLLLWNLICVCKPNFDPRKCWIDQETKEGLWIEHEFLGYLPNQASNQVESILGSNGKVVQVWCKVCTLIESIEKLLIPKLVSLWKHASHHETLEVMSRVKVGEHHFLKSNTHVANEKF